MSSRAAAPVVALYRRHPLPFRSVANVVAMVAAHYATGLSWEWCLIAVLFVPIGAQVAVDAWHRRHPRRPPSQPCPPVCRIRVAHRHDPL